MRRYGNRPQRYKAIRWLWDHPQHLYTPARALVALIGVSHMTIHVAQWELRPRCRRSK